MTHDFDYIVIGSGFGGSVSALRLSQKGYRVLVVEKGKWYNDDDFAKTNWQFKKWLWIPAVRFFGIMQISFFRHISVLSGTGVGGGSLVYANTLPVPKPAFYTSGSWAALADWQTELKPFYEKALQMLGATPNPKLFDGDLALKTMAHELGRDDQFEHPNVAVYFGNEGVTVEDPYFDGKGPNRTGCNFCGGCMTGCRHNAKNTLDRNYLFLAQKNGAKILAENLVCDVQAMGVEDGSEGYRVRVKPSIKLFKRQRNYSARGVIFAGGVIGTVKLLLALKKKSMPHLSAMVGHDIRTNNETLISVSSLDKSKDVSKGVAIGSIFHSDSNSHLEVVRYTAGSGFWKLLHWPWAIGKNAPVRLYNMLGQVLKAPISYFKLYLVNSWSKRTVVLLFMQTLDSKLRFESNGLGGLRTSISTGKNPTPYLPESAELTRRYSKIINGMPTSFALETLAGIPSTAHILGGAVMGSDLRTGVINKKNEVFGYANMYVIDGAMISANPGVNPALTITAIAERAMEQIMPKSQIGK